jgi:hypothetical protein
LDKTLKTIAETVITQRVTIMTQIRENALKDNSVLKSLNQNQITNQEHFLRLDENVKENRVVL